MKLKSRGNSIPRVVLLFACMALLVSCNSFKQAITGQPTATQQVKSPQQLAPTASYPLITQTTTRPSPTVKPEAVGEYSIVFERLDPADVILIDDSNNFSQTLLIHDQPAVKFLGWSKENCLAVVQDSTGTVYEVGLNGETVKTINFQLEGPDQALSRVDLSPDSTHLALIIGKGNLGLRRYEIQDIGITSLDTPSEIHDLTDNGDVYAASWSMGGDRLAYSNIDQNGIYQLFWVDVKDYEVKQATHLAEKSVVITKMIWVNGDKELLFTLYDQETKQPALGYIATDSSGGITFLPIDGLEAIYSLWQLDDKNFAAFMRVSSENVMVVINHQNLMITDRILESSSPEGYIFLPGRFREPYEIGFFSYLSFYKYDLQTKSFTKGFDKVSDVRAWSTIPNRLQNCFQQ